MSEKIENAKKMLTGSIEQCLGGGIVEGWSVIVARIDELVEVALLEGKGTVGAGHVVGYGHVKVLNSHDFNNYEVVLPFPAGTSAEKINEGRKVAQMLIDEAVRQKNLADQIQRKLASIENTQELIDNLVKIPRSQWSEAMVEKWEEYNRILDLHNSMPFNYNDDEEVGWSETDILF